MAPLLHSPTTPLQALTPPPHHSHRTTATPAAAFLRSLFPSLRRPPPAKSDLLRLIADQDRGLSTQSDPSRRAAIVTCIDALAEAGEGADTTAAAALSGTWRLLWTTEKEQLFIVRNAGAFRTAAGDVLQVIDVAAGTLNNVITFPPSGVFFVNGSIEIEPPQRVNFRFKRAVLRGSNWEIPLPPFGKGWFDTVYLDDDIRVAKDIRGDYLVVERAPYSWKEEQIQMEVDQ